MWQYNYTDLDELCHWKRGPKKNHKYIARIPSRNGYRYFYSQAEYNAYLHPNETKRADLNEDADSYDIRTERAKKNGQFLDKIWELETDREAQKRWNRMNPYSKSALIISNAKTFIDWYKEGGINKILNPFYGGTKDTLSRGMAYIGYFSTSEDYISEVMSRGKRTYNT